MRKLKHGGWGQREATCTATTDQWRVLDRYCNYSKFNGGHRTTSDYSSCKCMGCGHVWRTKADYVADLKDATAAERMKAI